MIINIQNEQQLKDDVEKFLNGENINLKDYEFTKTYIDKVNTIIKNLERLVICQRFHFILVTICQQLKAE